MLSALLIMLIGTLFPGSAVLAQEDRPDPLRDAGFEQKLDNQVPLGLQFQNADDQLIRLGDYFGNKPVILALGYYNCPMLCPITRDGLVESLKQIDYDVGSDYTVVNVSIDPRETSSDAAAQKAYYLRQYDRPGAADGWYFLTGEQAEIDELANSVGFNYVYDEQTGEYSHAAGIVMLTPGGKVARYFFGIEFRSLDLRLGLVETAERKIGAPIDQLLLLCYHYNPITGKYTGLIMTILRLAALITTLGIGLMIFKLARQNRQTPLTSA